MITQLVSAAILSGSACTLAPACIDAFNDAFSEQTASIVKVDAYTIGRTVIEESLLSDSGDTYVKTLTIQGNRISELPSIRLGNTTESLRYWNEGSRVWVEVCARDNQAVQFCAQFDSEGANTMTVLRDGVVVETR